MGGLDPTVSRQTRVLERDRVSVPRGSKNDDTKRLAAWVPGLAVPTMIAGPCGMNFDNIPALHWSFGYPVAMAFVFVVRALLYRDCRRSGWLQDGATSRGGTTAARPIREQSGKTVGRRNVPVTQI